MRQEPPQAQALTGAELRTYLGGRDDFAFEREVYTHAKGYGFEVAHAGLYRDQTKDKLRQFDVRACKENHNRFIRLAIECKALQPTYPLLVSCVPRASDEAYHSLIYSSSVSGVNHSHARIKSIQNSDLYPQGQYVGKDLVQVGRAKQQGQFVASDSDLFDKYQQALSSSSDLIGEATKMHRPHKAVPMHSAIVPILAVPDGTLWVAKYSSMGRLDADPVPAREIAFFLGREYLLEREQMTFKISHLHIMTQSFVTEFLRCLGQIPEEALWKMIFPAALMTME